MGELVDPSDLKSGGHCGRAGSTPAPGTKLPKYPCISHDM